MGKIQGFGKTDVGRERKVNQDCFRIDEDLHLYIVADGMGGHAAGEVASQSAIDVVHEALQKHADDIAAFDGAPSNRDALIKVVRDAIQQASADVFRKAQEDPSFSGMGTTLTLLLTLGQKALMGHVGDSRLYLKRGDAFTQLSEDHSYVQQLIRRGLLTEEEAEESPYANVITRAVGIQSQVEVDTLVFDLLPGDTFLLCSDGLTKHVPKLSEISSLIDDNPDGSLQRLIGTALERGGTDNVTSLLVTVTANSDPAETEVMIDDRVKTLQEVSLFYFLGVRELLRVLDSLEERMVFAGDVLIREGEPSESMFVIVDGEVSVSNKGKVLARLKPGDHFGEMGLLSNRPRSATVTADKKATLLCISRDVFNDLVKRQPQLGVKLLWAISQSISLRLEGANDARDAMRSVTVKELPFTVDESSRFAPFSEESEEAPDTLPFVRLDLDES